MVLGIDPNTNFVYSLTGRNHIFRPVIVTKVLKNVAICSMLSYNSNQMRKKE